MARRKKKDTVAPKKGAAKSKKAVTKNKSSVKVIKKRKMTFIVSK